METHEERLSRLLYMHGSDEGFYLLAVHAFVEATLRDRFPWAHDQTGFRELLDAFREDFKTGGHPFLSASAGQKESASGQTRTRGGATPGRARRAAAAERENHRPPQEVQCLSAFARSHYLANSVRHAFAPVDREEVRAATNRLIQFCKLAGIEAPETTEQLAESVEKVWVGRNTPLEDMKELRRVGFALLREQQRNTDLHRQISELEQARIDEQEAAARTAQLEAELETERTKAKQKSERVDELRARLHEQKEAQKALSARIAELEPAREYLANLTRVTTYARTRIDYERELTRLTPEQQTAVDLIRFDNDHLVKGAAGTGKTLVLLKALEKAVLGRDAAADAASQSGSGPPPTPTSGAASGSGGHSLRLEGDRPSVSLLTYTRTLVKYDRYIASLLNPDDTDRDISTADRFIAERLHEVRPDLEISYEIIGDLAARTAPAGGLERADLASEVEDFLFGSMVSHSEYVDAVIPRYGRRPKLGKEARGEVWQAAIEMASRMERTGTVSKNYGRLVLYRHLAGTDRGVNPGGEPGEPGPFTKRDFIFVDEVQDLAACDLAVLKACSNRCMIMAGDSDQAIYGPGFSFSRSDIDIRGRTRILKTNFRNSIQIHSLAEHFRRLSGVALGGTGQSSDTASAPQAAGRPSEAAAGDPAPRHPAGRPAGVAWDRETTPSAFRFGTPPERYVDADPAALQSALVSRVRVITGSLGYEYGTVAVLAADNEGVRQIRALLEGEGYRTADPRERSFQFADISAIRVSTMHSAKGLDFPVVILYMPNAPVSPRGYDNGTRSSIAHHLVYVCLTRAMEHLTVLMCPPDANVEADPRVTLERAFTDLQADMTAAGG